MNKILIKVKKTTMPNAKVSHCTSLNKKRRFQISEKIQHSYKSGSRIVKMQNSFIQTPEALIMQLTAVLAKPSKIRLCYP